MLQRRILIVSIITIALFALLELVPGYTSNTITACAESISQTDSSANNKPEATKEATKAPAATVVPKKGQENKPTNAPSPQPAATQVQQCPYKSPTPGKNPTQTRVPATATANPSRTLRPTLPPSTVPPSPTNTSHPPSSTSTPIDTHTPVPPSPTNTLPPKSTSTPSQTHTATASPSNTLTFTPSYTATLTASDTQTPAPSNTLTLTPSNTASLTPSYTATPSPSDTNTPTPASSSMTPLPPVITDTPLPPAAQSNFAKGTCCLAWFTAGNGTDEFLVPVQGGQPRNLTKAIGGLNDSGSIGPDYVVFIHRSSKDAVPELWIVDWMGANAHRLTPLQTSLQVATPRAEPCGNWVLFVLADGKSSLLYAIRKDGTGLTKLSENASDPSWSHDGKYITWTDFSLSGLDKVMTAKFDDHGKNAVLSEQKTTIAAMSISNARYGSSSDWLIYIKDHSEIHRVDRAGRYDTLLRSTTSIATSTLEGAAGARDLRLTNSPANSGYITNVVVGNDGLIAYEFTLKGVKSIRAYAQGYDWQVSPNDGADYMLPTLDCSSNWLLAVKVVAGSDPIIVRMHAQKENKQSIPLDPVAMSCPALVPGFSAESCRKQ